MAFDRGPKFDGMFMRKGLVTFKSALVKGTDEDKPVKVSAAGTVALAAANQAFCGIVREIDYSDKAAAVQMDGFASLVYTGSDPTITAGKISLMADGSGTVVLGGEVINAVALVVAQGQTAGSSSADPTLVGGKIVGIHSTTNQDQLVDSVAIDGSGIVTVTLAAAATGENEFTVDVEKAGLLKPRLYDAVDVDTTNKIITILLG